MLLNCDRLETFLDLSHYKCKLDHYYYSIEKFPIINSVYNLGLVSDISKGMLSPNIFDDRLN